MDICDTWDTQTSENLPEPLVKITTALNLVNKAKTSKKSGFVIPNDTFKR